MTLSAPIAAIERIEKALEGVTPGPWKDEGYVVMGDWHASGSIASVRSGARAFNDAKFIAACSPNVMPGILALARQADEKAAEAETMRAKAIANAQERNAAERQAKEMKREIAEKDSLQKVVNAVLTWAEQRCPCENENPNPCPLCGASVENLEPCKSAENTIPRHLLADLRRARSLTKGESDAGN